MCYVQEVAKNQSTILLLLFCHIFLICYITTLNPLKTTVYRHTEIYVYAASISSKNAKYNTVDKHYVQKLIRR